MTAHTNPRTEYLLSDLRARLRALEGQRRPPDESRISTGHAPLDGLLPERGLRRGTLVEWLEEQPGAGAGTLALSAARQACGEQGVVMVVDSSGEFYPPAAVGLGIDLRQLILVRPRNDADEVWAI